MCSEFGGQGSEELLIGRWIPQREVIDRVDNADPEVVTPDPIYETLREIGILRGSQPIEETTARILVWLDGDGRPAERLDGQWLLCFRVRQEPGLTSHKHFTELRLLYLFVAALLFPFGVFVVDHLLRLRRASDRDLAEDVGKRTVIVLAPAVVGMLMTLCAFQANAHERGCRLLAP